MQPEEIAFPPLPSGMDESVDAGEFVQWHARITLLFGARSDGGRDSADSGSMDVPCGDCSACCRSAQFVHVRADERRALSVIPAALLVPAPGTASGERVLGFDAHGNCPMMSDDGCTIYAERPQTCRSYDCRVFAAAGVEPDQPRIAERTALWRFTYRDTAARDLHRSVLAAGRFLSAHRDALERFGVRVPLQRAISAIRIAPLFERWLVQRRTDGAGVLVEDALPRVAGALELVRHTIFDPDLPQ